MILGIDLGTTKTAAVLYDPATPAESRAESAVHHAALPAAPAGILAQMLFLTPAVACDRRGVRLGRGGGFYDRLLAGENRAVAAIVYACQLTESLPREPHDRMVGFAVTEEDILTF